MIDIELAYDKFYDGKGLSEKTYRWSYNGDWYIIKVRVIK